MIRRDDVAKMVGAGRVETIWRTVDAATTGQAAEALADLDRLLGSGEHPVRLLAGMTFSLLKVHHAGQLRRARVELKEACQRAGIFAGGVEKTRQQHAHLGPARVDQLPGLLLQADLDLKGDSTLPPRVDPRTPDRPARPQAAGLSRSTRLHEALHRQDRRHRRRRAGTTAARSSSSATTSAGSAS